ncbi:hypothetical protein BC628DRAFT_1418595 [Trametes gibbosa]|nr:hypothetical protein BC628DRAFT_1418595 [Trametes gibbosa]
MAVLDIFGQQDHFAPHLSRKFDGYYTRAQTEDGGTIAVIFCRVENAKKHGNLVFLLYEPPQGTLRDPSGAASSSSVATLPAFKYQFFPKHFDIVIEEPSPGRPQAFSITAPGLGRMTVSASTIEYDIHVPELDLRLHLVLTAHTPWSSSGGGRGDALSGPMGPAILRLSPLLPLNWHVRSTHSAASYSLARGPASVRGTAARAHAEKNWGAAFPAGWLWAQAFAADGARTLCFAGGQALPGVPLQAYLVGYRSPRLGQWDFRPPFTLGLGPLSPFLRVRRDSRRGEVALSVATWFRKLVVRIAAPPESFVGVTAPLKDGHELDYAYESFQATVHVEAYERPWPWMGWELVEEAILGQTAEGVACGALEFGGAFSHLVGG